MSEDIFFHIRSMFVFNQKQMTLRFSNWEVNESDLLSRLVIGHKNVNFYYSEALNSSIPTGDYTLQYPTALSIA